MSDDAEVTMMLYTDLRPNEESVLKSRESAVFQALLAKSITARPIWTSSAKSGSRTVKLVLPDQPEPRVLLVLTPEEAVTLSKDELVSRLNRSLAQG
jgi:hypothetical protein